MATLTRHLSFLLGENCATTSFTLNRSIFSLRSHEFSKARRLNFQYGYSQYSVRLKNIFCMDKIVMNNGLLYKDIYVNLRNGH